MFSLDINKAGKILKGPGVGDIKAVDEVSLQVEEGKIFGLLGPNGAGKSTLINMISGIMRPDAGSIEVCGIDVARATEQAKRIIGVVPQEIVIEMAFTVEEVLYYYSGMYGVPRDERGDKIKEALYDLELEDKIKERARNLSGGMKRRLMIAKAIMHGPKLLILDEPTAGVDVFLRQKIWELVRRINNEGTTVLFTTHYLEEAEELCESIALINNGKIVKSGKLKDIQDEFSEKVIHFELYDREVIHLSGVMPIGREYEFPIGASLPENMSMLASYYGANIKSIRSEAVSLENIFLKLTNRG